MPRNPSSIERGEGQAKEARTLTHNPLFEHLDSEWIASEPGRDGVDAFFQATDKEPSWKHELEQRMGVEVWTRPYAVRGLDKEHYSCRLRLPKLGKSDIENAQRALTAITIREGPARADSIQKYFGLIPLPGLGLHGYVVASGKSIEGTFETNHFSPPVADCRDWIRFSDSVSRVSARFSDRDSLDRFTRALKTRYNIRIIDRADVSPRDAMLARIWDNRALPPLDARLLTRAEMGGYFDSGVSRTSFLTELENETGVPSSELVDRIEGLAQRRFFSAYNVLPTAEEVTPDLTVDPPTPYLHGTDQREAGPNRRRAVTSE